ncbi:MAG: fatty acid--CoA ligase family protein, partial [Thermodesulfobacteriota bacterium]|nr:fatty acid--CoA ligase family protein [Thermodesulfobacteriota bacterium]
SALLRLAVPKVGVLAIMVMFAFDVSEVKHILKETEARGIVIPWKFRERDYFETYKEIQTEMPHLERILVVGDEVPEGAVSIRAMMEHTSEKEYPSDYLAARSITTWEVQELQTTTGSTGLPKISEGFGWYQLQGHTIGGRLNATDQDIIGFVVPYIGGPGNCLWCVGLANGCKMVFLERFDPDDALGLVEKEKITILAGVPTVGEKLVRLDSLPKYDLSSLRVFYSAGAPMPPSLAVEIEEKMDCKVVSILGAMDFGPISIPSVDDPPEVRHYSLGKPLPGNEIRILDENGQDVPQGEEGELVCRGPHGSSGYYKMPEASLEAYGGDKDGWFRIKDLVRLDENGYLHIAGRLKDIIKRGAMTIAPVEIEDLLRTHPAVEDVAVIPIPDAVLGEKVCAVVIPSEGKEISFEEMTSFLRDKGLAVFKFPEMLEFIDTFPMKGGQKVAKRDLVDIILKRHASG